MIAPVIAWAEAPLVSSAALRRADEEAQRRYGIEPLQLMELAGWQVARVADGWLDGARGKRIAVIAGAGNNGGDALVAARHLHQRGAIVRVWVVSAQDPHALAARHARTIRELAIPVAEATAELRLSEDLVVDGLLGTGVRLPVRSALAALIEAVNAAGRPVIAVDVPSGLDADSGMGADACIRAVATVTLVAAKRGLEVAAAGRVFLADIGMPAAVLGSDGDLVAALYTRGDLLELRKRTPS